MMILGQPCAAGIAASTFASMKSNVTVVGRPRVLGAFTSRCVVKLSTTTQPSAAIEGLNQLIAEREIKQPPIRLSDTEIIKMALSYAADAMREAHDKAAKQGLVMLEG